MRQLLLLLLFSYVLVVVGCGKVGQENKAARPVEVWLDASAEILPLLRELVKPLAEGETPVIVNFRDFRFEDLKPAILGSKADRLDAKPDLIMVSSDWMGELVTMGLLQPLPEISFHPSSCLQFPLYQLAD